MWACRTSVVKPENVSLNVMVRAARLRSKSTVAVAGERIAPVSAAVGPGSGPVSSNPENVPWKSFAPEFAPSSTNGAAIAVTDANILKRMRSSLCADWISAVMKFALAPETGQKPDQTGSPAQRSQHGAFNPRLCQLHLTYKSGL